MGRRDSRQCWVVYEDYRDDDTGLDDVPGYHHYYPIGNTTIKREKIFLGEVTKNCGKVSFFISPLT